MNKFGKVVIGLGFGDEAKGLSTSYLCSITENPLVVRSNGGHQAGHTVVYNDKRHVFSSFGSGTLQDVPTYWSKYCTFYPTAFINEYNVLKNLGVNPKIFVHPLCPVTTPYDVFYNQKSEDSNRHGSVGVGFGATIQRQESYYKLFVQDLFYEKILIEKLKNIKNYYERKVNCEWPNNFCDDFLESVSIIKNIIQISGDEIIENFNPIFEGAQGILLDQDFGFFPNVTRSNTTSKNALEIFPAQEIFYVTRSYQTRHGNGFMTDEGIELNLINNQDETNKSHDYQGEFRTSPLDIELLNYALECDNHFSHGLSKNLIITCLDQHSLDICELLDGLKTKFDKVYLSHGPSLKNMSIFETKYGCLR